MHNQKDLGFKTRTYRDKRIKDHCSRMSSPNDTILFDSRVAAVLQNQGFSWVEAPRSIYKPEKLYEALAKYAPQNKPTITVTDSVRSGIALAYRAFGKPKHHAKLQPLPLVMDSVYDLTSNWTGSAGLTSFGDKKRDVKDIALDSATRILTGSKVPEPCIAFKRTQFNDKTRLVWGYPYSMTIIEGLLAQPLIAWFKGATTPMAFALPSGALGARIRKSAEWNKWAYSLDMSSFDSSISDKLIEIAFDVIGTWFDLEAIEPTTRVSYRYILHRIKRYFIATPIVMPDGKLYIGKSHGVPSGSYFTQLVDSIVNVILAGSISYEFNLHVSMDDLLVLGDDMLMWSNRHCDLDAISKFAKSTLGINVHGSEKSEIVHYTKPVHFLGRYWDHGIPDMPVEEVIKRLVYPETYRHYSVDPAKAREQVHLMFLSMAATYRSAWRLAEACYRRRQDHRHYDFQIERPLADEVDSDYVKRTFVSGLLRYRNRYISEYQRSSRSVAIQFWL